MYCEYECDEYTLELARLLPEFFLGSKEAADSSDYFQIFQAPKVIEKEGRGLNVCSDPQIAESDCKQKTGKCPSLRVWRWPHPAKLCSKCHVSKCADGQLAGQGEDDGEGWAGEGGSSFSLNPIIGPVRIAWRRWTQSNGQAPLW